ncbi:MAG: TrmB family transcriptional regulator [Candidatus Eisenbacteria sp.]|nr:TrmB family transcriptional regulator [Candidatus Eisenbacteria bacterium]
MAEVVDLLVNLGLARNEAKVYLALLERKNLAAAEVANLSGVPRQKVYEILKRLSARGLCHLEPGRPQRFRAVDPVPALGEYVEHCRKEQEEREDTATRLGQLLRRRYERGKDLSDPLDYITVLKHPKRIGEAFRAYEAESASEILLLMKEPYALQPPTVLAKEFAGRGGKLRVICESENLRSEKMLQVFEGILEHGGQIRHLEALPSKLAIFDTRIVMLPLEDPVAGEQLTTVIVEHPPFASLLRVAFHALWERAAVVGKGTVAENW